MMRVGTSSRDDVQTRNQGTRVSDEVAKATNFQPQRPEGTPSDLALRTGMLE